MSDESPLRVLVLEDDENMREILCDTLEDNGYLVDSASAGRLAVEKVRQHPFDVLILDVRMEGMSGLEAFALMKQQGLEIACLVITGFATEEDSIRAIRLGVGDYLRKPFEMRELLFSLARVTAAFLRQREARQRERSLRELTEWVSHQLDAERRPVAQAAAAIARSLDLGEARSLEMYVAASVSSAEGAPPSVQRAWEGCDEHWDGSGPRGWRGEDIPLEGRILALARASRLGSPAELARSQAGRLDPYLLQHLETGQADSRQALRLLALARTLAESGDAESAASALREASGCQPSAGLQLEIELTGLRLLPPAEQAAAAPRLLAQAALLGPQSCARAQLEAGLLVPPQEGLPLLRACRAELADEADRARADLALWRLGEGEPEGPLTVLGAPRHERKLAVSLPWLFPALIRWWSGQTQAHASVRLLRLYSSLLPAQLDRLGPEEKRWLLGQIREAPWAAPALQRLAQDHDADLRARAQEAQRCQAGRGATLPLLSIRSFGPFQVQIGGEPVPERNWRGNRNKFVMAFLAASGRTVPEEKLLDLFWSEEAADKAKKGLYNVLASVRKALRPSNWSGETDYIRRHRDQIGLNPDLERWHDLEEFERDCAAAQQAASANQVEQARALFRRALPLAEEPYLDGCYLDWALNQRTVLEEQRLQGLVRLGELDLQVQEPELALECTRLALLMDDCNQAAYALQMRACLALSRPEQAIRSYETATRKLKAEYDLEPSLELFELLQRARYA